MEPIFIVPVFKQMIWGGSRLRTEYGYDIPGDDTGECWAISAHPNGDCIIGNGEYAGMSLSTLWREHGELFGKKALSETADRSDESGDPGEKTSDVFPLFVKIIDACDDLSIQVHPDDEYARVHENGSLGKTECWYILDAKEGASIIIGHNAASEDELRLMIDEGRWSELIREIPVKKGDFFQITPGTVHAIKKGTMILETQQNSDVTYRLYDYDRLSAGKPRELHIKQSIDVIEVPFAEKKPDGDPLPTQNPWFEELIHCDRYVVWHAKTPEESAVLVQDRDFLLVSVIDGEGSIGNTPIKKGDHFILPYGYEDSVVSGDLEFIISSV